MISSSEDSEIIKQIDSLTEEELLLYSQNYLAIDLKHYMSLQLQWMNETKYFVGMRLQCDPSDDDLLSSWVEHHNPERFRAYYVLKYTDKVEKIN